MCFENSFEAYPHKKQEDNPSKLIIVILYKDIVTGIFVKYQLPQETLTICKSCDAVEIDEKWFRKNFDERKN